MMSRTTVEESSFLTVPLQRIFFAKTSRTEPTPVWAPCNSGTHVPSTSSSTWTYSRDGSTKRSAFQVLQLVRDEATAKGQKCWASKAKLQVPAVGTLPWQHQVMRHDEWWQPNSSMCWQECRSSMYLPILLPISITVWLENFLIQF